LFAEAFDTSAPNEVDLREITENAISLWREYGEMTNRAAVQSVVAAFHRWRERSVFASQRYEGVNERA
jgi:phosphotransacetylase